MTTELSTHVGDGLVWDNTGKLINADFGATAGTICEGDDARLTDDRDPTAHASTHLPGGADALTAAAAGTIQPDDTAAEGAAASFARSDHRHAIATGAASANPPGTANAEGVSTSFARADHTHALAAFGSGAGTFCEGNDSRLTNDRDPNAHAADHLPGGGDALTTAAAGTISPDDTAATGSAASFARSDHRHQITCAVAGTIAPDDAAAEGVSTSFSRADHTHAITCAAATANPPGTANAEGVATSFARSDHTHALAAFGTGGTNFCVGNDARLSDDRTASGLRSATTVVSVSAATAPSSGQVLTATASTTATWQTPAGATAAFPAYFWGADAMDNPVTADWAVNSLAAASACTNNSGLLVRRFANAAENGVGVVFPIPTAATNIVFGFRSRAETTPAGTVAVIPRVYVREFPDNAAVESWSAGTDLTALSFPTNELWQYDSQTIALSTLSLVGGRVVQVELTRRGSDGSDTLTTDWTLLQFEVSFT